MLIEVILLLLKGIGHKKVKMIYGTAREKNPTKIVKTTAAEQNQFTLRDEEVLNWQIGL